MIQMINKPKQSTFKISLQQKILSQMKSLASNKKQKNQHPHLPMSKQQEDEGRRLFDQINIQQSNNNDILNEQNKFQQNISQQFGDLQQQLNEQDQQQMEGQQRMANKIKSILKNTNVSKKQNKKVTFEGISEGKRNYQLQKQKQNDFILLQQNRKWGEKLKNPRKGKFDPEQRRTLIKSLSQCLSTFNLEYQQIVKSMSDQDDEKIPRNLNFWTKVCSVLTNRSIMSSYKFLKRQLSTKNKGGQWTEDQTIKLEQLVHQYGRKWSLIAKQMHRTAQNIRDKFRIMGQQKYDPSKLQTVWKFKQLVKYLKKLQKYCSTDFLDESKLIISIDIQKQLEEAERHDEIEMKQMKQRKYNSKTFNFHNNEIVRKYINKQFSKIKVDQVNWQKISDKMENKTIFDCRNKFIQLLQLQICGMDSKQYFQKQIVKFVINQRVKQENQINWSKWRHDDMESEQAKNRWMILKRHIQGRGQKTFAELLKLMALKVGLE